MDVTTNTMLPLQQRPTELGRIRLGAKAETSGGKEYPRKLETWRLTSASLAYLNAAAELYGGTPEKWEDAPDEGYYELFTEAESLPVMIPRDLVTLTQAFEEWSGGTCQRRCDTVIEQISGGACLCDPADRTCKPRTRLSIMLPDLPGLGVWRLETTGYNAATSLPATLELLKSLSVQPWIRAVLRLEQRSQKKKEDGKTVTHRFAVPVLDTPPEFTVGKIVARMGNGEAPQIEAESAQPQTARERVAEQRAAIEAGTNGTGSTTRATSDGPEQGEEGGSSVPPDEPPHPAGQDAEPSGFAQATEAPDRSPLADERPGQAGARADTPEPPSPGSTDSGEPTPAPDAKARCEGFHAEMGACEREPDHKGLHRSRDKETWK